MKTLKRIVAGMLVLLLIVTAIPENCFSSLALSSDKNSEVEETIQNEEKVEVEESTEQETGKEIVSIKETGPETITYAMATSTAIITESGSAISRAEWLHNLVVVFEMMVETSALPDNYFSDLKTSHKYYEDILLAVTFGAVNVEEGTELRPDDALTRDFAVSTMNFCLGYQLPEDVTYTFSDSESCSDPTSAQIAINRGWVELIDGCFDPEKYLTTEEAEFMIADAQNVLEGQTVDENHENVFEFAEDVIVVADGTFVEQGENEVISITDCSETISVGDKFAVYFNGIPSVYTASSVTVNDTITVIETKSVESEDAFETVDAEGIIGTDAMEIIPAEGVEVKFEEDNSGASTYGLKKVKNFTTEVPISFSGITAKVAVKIKNPYVEYNVDGDKAFATFYATTETTYSISGNVLEMGGLKKGLTLFTVNVAGVGSFDISINVDFSGSASGTVKGDLVAGVECSKDGGIRAIKNFVQKESYTNAEASAAVSLRASFGVTKMPVLSAYVYAEVGIRASFSKKTYTDDNKPTQCVHHAAYLYAHYGASASAKLGLWKTSESVTYTIYDESNSPVRIVNHYEDGNLVAKCTRGNVYKSYYTTASSRWSGCGWTGANGTYALNEDGTPFVLYSYTLNENNEATITKYNGNAWSVYIPEEIDGYTVVGIGNSVFRYKDIRYVVIPNTARKINSSAFSACQNLQSVKLSQSLIEIGDQAFFDCVSLSDIELPKSLTTLGAAVFKDCDAMSEVFVPKALTTAYTDSWGGPFARCSGLKTVTFEENITNVPSGLFDCCDGLEEITIPNTVTNIGSSAFHNCTSLTKITLPNQITEIHVNTFNNCTSLIEVEIPNTVTDIENQAFYECSSLKSIVIPDGVTYIGSYAFDSCVSLENVKLPNNIQSISGYVFRNCKSLKTIDFPETVNIIHNYAFAGCTDLENLTFSNGSVLREIQEGVFSNCSSFKNIFNFSNSLINSFSFIFSFPFLNKLTI